GVTALAPLLWSVVRQFDQRSERMSRSTSTRSVAVIGVTVAALLVVPAMAGALGGSGTRVKGVISQLLTGDVVTGVRGESAQQAVFMGGVHTSSRLTHAIQ